MITRINESKTITKQILCESQWKFMVEYVIWIKSIITLSASVSVKVQKNIVPAEKVISGIKQGVAAKIVNIQEVKKYHWWFSSYILWNYRKSKNYSSKRYFSENNSNKNYYNKNVLQQLFTFYKPFLITIALLLLISISIYLPKHRSKQNHLLPYHDISKLKETEITNILQKLKVMIN